uniref:Uncharacterized protein n=1 Tax=Romanomermis culicivorax TaxID=13658 RepID=A0A915IBH5_ROMCU
MKQRTYPWQEEQLLNVEVYEQLLNDDDLPLILIRGPPRVDMLKDNGGQPYTLLNNFFCPLNVQLDEDNNIGSTTINKWGLDVGTCNVPPINIEVKDDIDELDALEVQNDESHIPQEPIRQIGPNTSSHDDNNLKCSFDYKTGFSTFVDQTVKSYEVEKPCKKAA